jgi:MoxR-like ATPase
MAVDVKQIGERVSNESAVLNKIRTETHKVIVGQEDLLDRLLMALLRNQHALIDGVPGLAKTLLATTLARMTQSTFRRI